MAQPVHHTRFYQGGGQNKDRAQNDDDFIGKSREDLLRSQNPEENQGHQEKKRDDIDREPLEQEKAERSRQQKKQD